MNQPYRPSPEPEIIPPGAPLPGERGLWATADIHRTHYVYATRLGPVSLALMTLAGGAIAVLAVLFLLSTAAIGLAVIGALALTGLIAGILRGPPRPLR